MSSPTRRQPCRYKNKSELATDLLEVGLLPLILLGMDVQPDIDAPEFIARLRASEVSAWTTAIRELGSDLLAFVKYRSYSNSDDLCQTMWLFTLKLGNPRDLFFKLTGSIRRSAMSCTLQRKTRAQHLYISDC